MIWFLAGLIVGAIVGIIIAGHGKSRQRDGLYVADGDGVRGIRAVL